MDQYKHSVVLIIYSLFSLLQKDRKLEAWINDINPFAYLFSLQSFLQMCIFCFFKYKFLLWKLFNFSQDALYYSSNQSLRTTNCVPGYLIGEPNEQLQLINHTNVPFQRGCFIYSTW